jgi:hypothetical protein
MMGIKQRCFAPLINVSLEETGPGSTIKVLYENDEVTSVFKAKLLHLALGLR